MYKKGLKAVVSSPNKFTDNMNCAICQKKHQFDKCPILLDIEYLKKHFITYCLLWIRTYKQIQAAINRIKSTMADNTAIDKATDTVTDNSNTTTDEGADFQEREE